MHLHRLRNTSLIIRMSTQGNDLGAFQETDASVLEVSQCSADVFRAVLAYIYTGRSAPSLATVWDLTAVAEFYMLSGLQASLRSVCTRVAFEPCRVGSCITEWAQGARLTRFMPMFTVNLCASMESIAMDING